MSVNGALRTGVSGLSANSTALTVASSNISNSNTTAYKESSTAFSTLIAETSSTKGKSSGVNAVTEQSVSTQGDLTATSSTTDLAISGSGFFITSTVADGTNIEYSRAGDFSTNKAGDLVNSSGLYLMGYAVSTNATTGVSTTSSTLSTINLDKTAGIAEASSHVTLTGNLESTTDVTGATDYSNPVTISDGQGGSQSFAISYTKTSANNWTYSIVYSGDSANLTNAGSPTIDTGTLTFNSDGSLDTVTSATAGSSTDGSVALTLSWDTTVSGLGSQDVSFDFGSLGGTDGFTQYATTSTQTFKADGASYGTVSSYSIGTDGTLTATYSNSLTRQIYAIPVAVFADPDGLTSVSGTAYVASDASGAATVVTAGSSGSGTIQSEYLEESAVDLATELTNLITTQRAYQACAKIVTTSTTMLDVLVNMG
ncbi:MAG: flagellar hook protein FlgE [Rhizomicrobium sp.]